MPETWLARLRRRGGSVAVVALLAACGMAPLVATGAVQPEAAPPAATGFVLEIQMANLTGGTAQLFYDIGQWYNQRDSFTLAVPAGPALRWYRFPIPAEPIRQMRFDPDVQAATVRIGQMRLTDTAGNVLETIGPESLRPMHSIESIELRQGVATLRMGNDDPNVLINHPLQPVTEKALGTVLVGAPGVIGLGLAVAALMAFVAVVLGRLLVPRKDLALLLAGVFGLVAGVRLHWLHVFSRPMPFLDEWETDALDLIIPLRGHFLNLSALFMPQSEHRILVTRLITLDGSLWNGEWDPRVGMTAGVILYALGVSIAVALAARAGGWKGRTLGLLLAGAACMPFDFSNLLWGDQSQMYALTLFCTVILALAALMQPTRAEMAALGAAALISLFTMGSGFVAPAVGAGTCAWRAWAEPPRRAAFLQAAALLAAFALAGILLYRPAPFYAPAYTQAWTVFWPALRARLAWPLPDRGFSVVMVWTPWLLLCRQRLGRRGASPVDYFAAALGCWALVNAAGLAHGRPQDVFPFDSKYYTALSLGTVCAVVSTAALWRTAGRLSLPSATLASVASLVLLFHFAELGRTGLDGSYFTWLNRCACDGTVRPYLADSHDTRLAHAPPQALPGVIAVEVAARLDSPLLQPWLPAVLRQSLTARPGAPVHGPQTPGPLTRFCRNLMKADLFLSALGGAAALLSFFWPIRRHRYSSVVASTH